MQIVLGIGGVFFRSGNPEGLAKWYKDHLGVAPMPTSFQQQPGCQLGEPNSYPNGTFARLHDPEGKPIELWEPSQPG